MTTISLKDILKLPSMKMEEIPPNYTGGHYYRYIGTGQKEVVGMEKALTRNKLRTQIIKELKVKGIK